MTNQEIERLVAWAAQECEWQMTGPLQVGYLIDAYFTLSFLETINEFTIRRLGHQIEPEKNSLDHFREEAVFVGYYKTAPWQELPRLIDQLLTNMGKLSPTEFFKEFEEIHPFIDGNGRTGTLLYNFLNRSYAPNDLMFPPNLWNDPRREGVQLP